MFVLRIMQNPEMHSRADCRVFNIKGGGTFTDHYALEVLEQLCYKQITNFLIQ